MKKTIILVLSTLAILLLTGCGTNTPKDKTNEYLSRYNLLSDDVVQSINTSISKEGLSTSNQNKYREVLERQYKSLKYEIKDETINGDDAAVNVQITVYDLFKSEQVSLDYLNNNHDQFYNDDIFNQEEYDKYKIENMLNTSDVIVYDIIIYLKKQNGTWIVQNPDTITLEKIHGIYNYE